MNDRPYVASSLLSVAIARLFGTAMAGRSKDRPELALTRRSRWRLRLPVVAAAAARLLEPLFEPVGLRGEADAPPLDEQFPSWGESDYFSVRLRRTCRLSELLTHLYVLIPVLDDEKHYWVGDDEVEKLLRRGEGWLQAHPERELIVQSVPEEPARACAGGSRAAGRRGSPRPGCRRGSAHAAKRRSSRSASA